MKLLSKAKKTHRIIGVEISENRIFAVIRDASGLTDFYESKQDEADYENFTSWLKSNRYDDLPVYITMLHSEYYQQLVDAPAVPDEELQQAIQFSAHEFLMDHEEHEVQAIKLPANAFHGRKKMVMAVSVKKTFVDKITQFFHKIKTPILNISITELSILQLLSLNDQPASVGVWRLNKTGSELWLYNQGAIYLTREIDMGIDSLEGKEDNAIASMALKLQRSMDYFESQMGLPPLNVIYVLQRESIDIDEQLNAVNQSLNIDIRPLTINYLFSEGNKVTENLPAGVIVAAGGAMSYELGS